MEKKELINIKYAQINELKSYLFSTDYHILKRNDHLMLGLSEPYVVPEDVLMQRHNARININALEDEIASLEAEILAEEAMLHADGYLPEDEIE